MKKLIKILVVLVLALLLAALAAPFMISTNTYKAEAIRRVKEATGRDLAIAGPVRLSFLPSPGVYMEKVSLSNPKGYATPNMLAVESLNAEVALLPLLSGQVQVKKLSLDKPVIDLEVSVQGVPNWRFTPQDQVPEAPVRQSGNFSLIASAEAAELPPSGIASALAVMQKVQLNNVRISNGTVHYADHHAGKDTLLEDVNLKLVMRDMNSPFTLNFNGRYNARKLSADAGIGTLAALFSGHETDIKLNVSAEPWHALFDGRATLTGAKGNLTISAPMALSGMAGVVWSGSVPYVAADLHTDTLDLSPYMAANMPEKSGHYLIADAEAAAPAGWSEAPIDLAPLRAANADVKLHVGKLVTPSLKAGQTEVTVALKNGILHLTIPSIALYDGQGKGDVTLDSSAREPEVNAQMTLSGVQVQPLLKDTSQFDRLEGKMDFTLNATGRGTSQKAIVSALRGDGKFALTNGALRGVNLTQIAQNAQALLRGGAGGTGDSDKTEFKSLTGTYTIANGIVHNGDLLLQSTAMQANGAGDIDLPSREVHYRVTPQLPGLQKGGKAGVGMGIPVMVEGPFDHLTFRPDLQSAMQGALKNPEAVKNTVNSVKQQLKKGNLQNILNGLGR